MRPQFLATAAVVAVSLLCGCMSVHAQIPEDMVRHYARKEGADVGAICSHGGQSYSEGAIVCMGDRLMVCDPVGRWASESGC